jgi:hypothetical protein
MILRFYNRDRRWFADVPSYIEAGGTEDDCEMVAGADEWLDLLAKEKDSITLEIGETPLDEQLKLYEKDEAGGTYIAHTYKEEDVNHVMWLCNVTIFVFGYFPPIIHYKIIK